MNIVNQNQLIDELYCKKCKKRFTNKGTLDNHMKSKTHNKNTTSIKCSKPNNNKSIITSQDDYLDYEINEIETERISKNIANLLERGKKHKELKMKRNVVKDKEEKTI